MYRLNLSSRCIYLIVILLYMISASLSQNYTWKFFPMSLKTLGQPLHHCEVEPRSLCVLGPLPPSYIPTQYWIWFLVFFHAFAITFYFMWWLYSVYMYCTTYVPDIQRAQKRAGVTNVCDMWVPGAELGSFIRTASTLNHWTIFQAPAISLAILLLFEIVTK